MTADPRDPTGIEGENPSDENMAWEDTGGVDADALPEGDETPEEAVPEEQSEELYETPEDEGTYTQDQEEPVSPKRNYLFPAVASVVILVTGFIVYTQVKPLLSGNGSNPTQPLPPLPIAATPSAGPAPGSNSSGSTPGQIPSFPGGATNETAPSSIPLPVSEEEAAKASRPFISGPSESPPLEAGQPSPVIPPETAPETTAPSAPLGALPPNTTGSEGSPLLQTEEEEIASAPVSTPLPPSTPAPAAQDRLEQLEKSVAALHEQQAAVTQLKDTVSRLESQVADLQAALASTKPKAKSVQEQTKTPTEKIPTTTVPGTESNAPKAPSAKPESASPEPATSPAHNTPSWAVVSATPSQAWVKLEGKNIQRRVVIGDTLLGIGQITSIHKEGTHWVIEGTQGKTR